MAAEVGGDNAVPDPVDLPPRLVEVRFLGGFALVCGGVSLQRLGAKATSVLAYIIHNRDRPQTRDLLAGRFWFDRSEDRARRQLSNALWKIRKAAEDSGVPDLLLADRSKVSVAPGLVWSVDAEVYEAALDDLIDEMFGGSHDISFASRLADAVNAYTGEYLSGHYDDWMQAERRRLSDRQVDALTRLISMYRGVSDYKRALRFASELVDLDPLREESHQEVMRLYGILGNSAAVERQFELCRRVMQEELGSPPSDETARLLDAIRVDSRTTLSAGLSSSSDLPRMVGRDRERTQLSQALNGLSGGRGGFVLIEGDPGIGKSRLIEDMTERADFLGLRTLRASLTAVSAGDPYQAFREMLGPVLVGLRAEHVSEAVEPVWLRQVGHLLPGLRGLTDQAQPSQALHPDEEPARMSEALARILLTQGAAKPTVLIFEDVHWADGDSMHVLSALSSRLVSSGLLICVTYRRFEAQQSPAVWSAITDMEASGISTVLQLGPLSDVEAKELVSGSSDEALGWPEDNTNRLVADAGGNPLYLLETLRDPNLVGGGWNEETRPAAAGEYPAALRRAIADRLEVLPSDASRVLAALAVLTERTSGGLIREVTGLSRAETLVALDLIVDRHFVVESEAGEYQFVHDQTRRVVLSLLDDGQVAESHRSTYQALHNGDTSRPDRLAYHARLGGLWAEAHRWYTTAAEQAVEVNAFAVAASHYGYGDEAGDNAGIPLSDRLDEVLEYERALDVIGNRSQQSSVLKRLEEVELPIERRLTVLERQAWLLHLTEKTAEALRSARAGVAWATENGLPSRELLLVLGESQYRTGDVVAACDSFRLALDAAEEDQAVSSVVAAKNLLGRALVDLSRFDEAEKLLEEAMDSAGELNDVRSQIDVLNSQFNAAYRSGAQDRALRYLEQTLELSRSIGYRRGEARNLMNLASFHTVAGQAGRALSLFDEAGDVASSLGDPHIEAFVRLNLAELKHRLLGDDEDAAKLARLAAGHFKSVGDRRREILGLCKLSRIDWRAGRRRLAKRRLRYLIELAETRGEAFAEIEARRIAAEFAIESADFDTATSELDSALELSEEELIASVRPAILAQRAVVAAHCDELETALQLVREAVPMVQRQSEFAFVTAWQCGQVLAMIGEVDTSAAQFRVAFDLLEANLTGLTDDQFAQAWRIPEFAAIAEAFERVQARTRLVRLPAIDAPLGRTLLDSEFLPVTLTVSDPADWLTANPAERRQQRIMRLADEAVASGAIMRVLDVARLLNVSDRTVKRDLKELRTQGKSPRTRRTS